MKNLLNRESSSMLLDQAPGRQADLKCLATVAVSISAGDAVEFKSHVAVVILRSKCFKNRSVHRSE